MKKFFVKSLLFLGIVAAFIAAADLSGLFKADQKNNHDKAAWDGFYEFTEDNEVDVLMIGNSHLYTGINPNHLSCLLGANCYILASPGVSVIDNYYALKEALSRCHPSMVVLETYSIGNRKVREFKDGDLSDEYKSFSSRRNIFRKLASTPVLFSPDHYLSAWSTSVRNHDFLFRDPGQIKANRNKTNAAFKKKDLELGRFIRFTSGITEKTDSLYDVLGPVVDGNKFRVNRENYSAVKKIQALCRKKEIPLVYLTIPMYHKHVTNYSSWKTIVSRVLGQDARWLDLQSPYDGELFGRDCFEDTRKENQHTTARGARICDYKFVDFLVKDARISIPDRHESEGWKKLFYGQDGYFEMFPFDKEDRSALLLCENVDLAGQLYIKDCILQPDETGATLYMKVDRRVDPALISHGVEMSLELTMEGKKGYYRGFVRQVPGADPPGHYLLMGHFKMSGITGAELLSIGVVGLSED